jgi:branched-chain amino acid transport system substrate-binding protein
MLNRPTAFPRPEGAQGMLRTIRGRRRAAFLTAALLVTTGALAACGSDDGTDDTGSTGSTGGNAVLGTPNKAEGAPVLVGFVATGKTPATDTTDEIKGAEAVVKYANAYLGGLGGRPIELVVCEEKSIPATAQDCANQFVSKKVLVVDSGSSGAIGLVAKGVAPAGIPVLSNLSSDSVILQGTNTFSIGNPLNPFGGPTAFARQEGNKKVTALVIDVPSAAGPAAQLLPAFAKNAGVTGVVVPIAPGTADMSAQVQSAISNVTDQFHLIGDPAFCTAALKSIKNLAFKGDVTLLDRCINDVGRASIPGGYEGTTVIGQANFSPDSEEFKLYEAILKDDGVTPSTTAASGYQGALALVRALNAAKITDFTTTGITAALKAAPASPVPLGDGATFRCDGTAIAAVSKAICSTFGVAGAAAKDGSVAKYGSLDTSGIYKLG